MADDIDALQFPIPQREKVLRQVQSQLDAWRLTMPPSEPLVLDFGSGDFAKHGLVEFWIANEVEAGYCGKFMFLFANQTCPCHSHVVKHETFFIVKGRVQLMSGGKTHTLNPGDVFPVPTNEPHTFTAVDKPALVLELSMPCDVHDNQFRDPWAVDWLQCALKGKHKKNNLPDRL